MNDTALNLPMHFLPFAGKSTMTISARDLHKVLEVSRFFSNWIKDQIDRAELVEGEDYLNHKVVIQVPHQAGCRSVVFAKVSAQKGENPPDGGEEVFHKDVKNLGGRPTTEYYLTLEAAKIVCMMSQSKLGNAYRRYLVQVESEWLAGRGRGQAAPQALDQLAEAAQRLKAARSLARQVHPSGRRQNRVFAELALAAGQYPQVVDDALREFLGEPVVKSGEAEAHVACFVRPFADPAAKIRKSELHRLYAEACKKAQRPALHPNQFGHVVGQLGYQEARIGKGRDRYWQGLGSEEAPQ